MFPHELLLIWWLSPDHSPCCETQSIPTVMNSCTLVVNVNISPIIKGARGNRWLTNSVLILLQTFIVSPEQWFGGYYEFGLVTPPPRPRLPRTTQRFPCERSTGLSSFPIFFKFGVKVSGGLQTDPIDFGVRRSPGCYGNHDLIEIVNITLSTLYRFEFLSDFSQIWCEGVWCIADGPYWFWCGVQSWLPW